MAAKKRNKPIQRWNVGKLAEGSIKSEYQRVLSEKLQEQESTEDIETNWLNIKNAVIETADDVLG